MPGLRPGLPPRLRLASERARLAEDLVVQAVAGRTPFRCGPPIASTLGGAESVRQVRQRDRGWSPNTVIGSEVHVPKHRIATDAIPLLGVGKTDFAAARTLVGKGLGDKAKTSSR
jgi:hypothetical protein